MKTGKTENESETKPSALSGERHLLLERGIRPIANWNEWLKCFEGANTFEEMLGLLHAGFAVSFRRHHYSDPEMSHECRLIFYFNIADGWDDFYMLGAEGDRNTEYEMGYDACGNVVKKSPKDLRRMLAAKAFDMLCVHFFRLEKWSLNTCTDREEFRHNWELLVESELLFPLITRFFKVQPIRYSDVEVRNLSGRKEHSHNEKYAIDFLENMAKFLFTWNEEIIQSWTAAEQKNATLERNMMLRNRIDAVKPWMVQVLAKLGRFKLLENWILNLNDECVAVLKAFALKTRLDQHVHLVKEGRTVLTIDEACYGGSETAWFLKRLELKRREHVRLTSILQLEREHEKAAREIEKLAGK